MFLIKLSLKVSYKILRHYVMMTSRPFNFDCVNFRSRGRQVRVFMPGDYEFLTEMYGLSGARGNTFNCPSL